MKNIYNFFVTTVKGGIFVFLPLFVVGALIGKVIKFILKIGEPLIKYLQIESFLGKFEISLLVALGLVVLFFISGLLLKFEFFREFNAKIESVIALLIPKYDKIKDKFDNKLGDKITESKEEN